MIYRSSIRVASQELTQAKNEQVVDQDLRDVTKDMSNIFEINATPRGLTRKYKSEEIVLTFHCLDENADFDEIDTGKTIMPEEMEEGEYGVDF